MRARHTRHSRRANSPSRSNGSTPDRATLKAWGGYQAANWDSTRGFIYFPTLDSRRDLDSYSLYEMRRRSRWLVINSGYPSRIIYGIAAMVGSLTPVPLTGDKEWNQLALKNFTNAAGADLIFDVSGKFNFWSCQPMMTANRLMDGDILGVLTEAQISRMARIMFYEAHQLATDTGATAQDDSWRDGIKVSPQNRPLLFQISDGDKSVNIPALDVIFHCNYLRPGRARGEPALRHAINHLLDRAEVLGFMKLGFKQAAQIGYQITKTAPEFVGGPQMQPRGLGAKVTEKTTASGAKVKIEEAYKGGKAAEMNPGEEIKMLLDQRPHPNQLEFLEHLNRDIAWGLNCSPDILWNIAKLGGATARYVMADAQQTLIEPTQELLADQFCSRYWVYHIAKELKAGRLRPCQDPEWWQVGWQPQQKLTVDIGRDGKLYIDMHKCGLISLKRYHSQLGQNWKTEIDDYLDERAYIVSSVKDRGLSMDEAFPPQSGNAPAAQDTLPTQTNETTQNH